MSYALMQFLLSTYWGRKSEVVGRKPVMIIDAASRSMGLVAGSARAMR